MATAILHSRHFNTHNFEEVQPIPQWIKDKYQPNQYLWVLTDLYVFPVFAIFDHDIGKVSLYYDVKKINDKNSDSFHCEIDENDEPMATMRFNPMDELKDIIMLFKDSVLIPYFSVKYMFPYFSFNSRSNDTNHEFEITPAMMCNIRELQYETSFGKVALNSKLNLYRILASKFEFNFISTHLVNKELNINLINERSFSVFVRQFNHKPSFDREDIVFLVRDKTTKSGFTHGIKQEDLDTQIKYLELFEKLVLEYYKNSENFYNKVKDFIDSETEVEEWFGK
nr:MAG TPA: hypothetical protein [Caudoviricetes sp.]DAY37491.1 MAG TPA: hypothetical protein [Caudoviricetes sp.]